MNQLSEQVLHHLSVAAPHFVSGSELSQLLNVSATAIWKHITQLRHEGYAIEAVTGRGYRLLAMSERAVAAEVQPLLTTASFGRFFHYYDEVTSTNLLARELAQSGTPEGTVVVADTQRAGRGRMGRSWVSPSGVNLYFSLVLRPQVPLFRVPQVTLLVAAAVHQAIKKLAPDVALGIKWPNDLLVQGKKVAGILCEMFSEPEQVHFVIVGIGINLNQKEFAPELEDRATSLLCETALFFSRPQLLAEVLNAFEPLYQQWLGENDLSFILPYLEEHASLTAKEVVIEQGNRTISGTVVGLAQGGELRLITSDGESLLVASGEAHLRQQ
uniref:Bifunctional ligase/repressor BirA n=1 Tax=Chlorobium chlorochromatii (strain CaD3) TaxID=340177 RepID=Q3ANX5_CHLCH